MNNIMLIADDLTGACDAGVQFTKRGMKAAVYFDKPDIHADSHEVCIIDLDSRSLTKQAAYKKVQACLNVMPSSQSPLFYKKIDSTLRGNIGSEIDAMMDVFSFDFAVIAPALPALGRLTKAGRHYLHGTPVEETEIGTDPKTPVKESRIVELLSEQSSRKAISISQDKLKNEKDWEKTAAGLLAQSYRLFVLDAESEEDLKRIAATFSKLPFRILWVGSAGLAEALPIPASKSLKNAVQIPHGTVLTLAGSRAEITSKQIEYMLQFPKMGRVTLDPDKLHNEIERTREIGRCLKEAETYIKDGKDLVIHVHQKGSRDINTGSLPSIIVYELAAIASAVTKKFNIAGMILTGGDTARSIAAKMGVRGIELVGELEIGLPLSKMIGGPNLWMATKAGAFGNESSLYQAYQSLKGAVEI
ncbi:four-carbon acid sugar kinase family protein [Bacillus massiliglaciei]|uniref:four-carbon acid sugar kinase family protein n=1 Tax=Bacillus massiliglaciei TaxID=1816693 RepID=UPI000B1AF279|nr:four-carbon acid sugar kinase family protein [Bacillus massiliglaciei]